MKHFSFKLSYVQTPAAALVGLGLLAGHASQSVPEYLFLEGSTHAHTALTWSHGEQFAKGNCKGIQVYADNRWSDGYVKGDTGCAAIFVINSLQYPGPGMKVKPDWEEYQGLPQKHFELAKARGYDFYVTTDHSQEATFQPKEGENTAWKETKEAAAKETDNHFVALAGFEYSENDGPGGQGHINVINSAGMVNALAPGMDLPHMYKWLESAQPNGEGTVVATFNHPSAKQYNDWDYRTPGVTDKITMLEVINSNNKIHEEAFIHALDKGWKVSPVCGNDNHGLTGIKRSTSRTVVLATERTKTAILDAMRNRRTYASLDGNIHAEYTVNGQIMGSTLKQPQNLQFSISISDPETSNPSDKITKLEIVANGGVVLQTYDVPTPGYSVNWSPLIANSNSKYVFVRVWNAGGGDAPGANPANPIAWLAPVWTGR